MTKKEAFEYINHQKGLNVLTQKNAHFANIGDYHGKRGWWINIPFKKFANNLYLVLNDNATETLVLIEMMANSVGNPQNVFRTIKENEADLFVIETDGSVYMDVQATGANYVFSSHHKVYHYHHGTGDIALNAMEYDEYIEQSIEKSLKDDQKKRLTRLKKASRTPEKIEVVQSQFKRNPDVVAEVLNRANGICEKCKQVAPFVRKKDNTPYLEVHHIVRLASGGEDTVTNAIAVCPNCHRELHYG